MKMTVWDRILSAISGALITAAGLCLLDIGLGTSLLGAPWVNTFSVWWQRAVVIVVALLLIALGVHGIVLLFRRRHEKGFIIQHSEYGDMSISMNALESMVQKCVASHQELKVNATRIQHAREGIVVDIKITLLSGVNIPLTVNALQKQIKQYITSCSGVDVHKVRVMVETDGHAAFETDAQPASGAPDSPAPPADSVDEPIFRHVEDAASYAVSAGETPESSLEEAVEQEPETPAENPEEDESAPDTPARRDTAAVESVEGEENA
ncbi:MAG TPA: alkaline shock response membrane anchor protein AmaP [Candidatus Limiplasma pullicola]|nr:alkaline shock response membrane anchor protein AmaP [Candidatus Limiplasma pullicola]